MTPRDVGRREVGRREVGRREVGRREVGRRCVLGMALAVAGCGSSTPVHKEVSQEVVRSLTRYTKEYVLQPGDQIEVGVFQVPDLTRTVTIRSDGHVSLPIVRDIKASGLTIPAFTEELRQRYATRLVNPEVTVNVANPRDAKVYVLGEVARPGPVPFRNVATAAQAIAECGGVARSGSQKRVALVRLSDDGYLTGQVIDGNDSGDTAYFVALQQMILQPGDLVIVPESGRSEFVRAIQDFVTTPLGAINQVLSPYYEFKLLSIITPK
jgi:polysaccharide biosynthesis/export protein